MGIHRRSLLAAPLAAIAFVDLGPDLSARIDELFDAYRAMNVDRLMSLLTDDVQFEDPTFRLRHDGREAVRGMAVSTRARFPSVRIVVHTKLVSGSGVATEQSVTFLPVGRGRPITVRGASFFVFRDDRICRWTDYYDFQTFQDQMRPGS